MEVIPWTPEELEALESLTRTWPRGSPKWHDELFCATWFMRPVLRARSVQEVMDWGRNPPPPPPTEDDNERFHPLNFTVPANAPRPTRSISSSGSSSRLLERAIAASLESPSVRQQQQLRPPPPSASARDRLTVPQLASTSSSRRTEPLPSAPPRCSSGRFAAPSSSFDSISGTATSAGTHQAGATLSRAPSEVSSFSGLDSVPGTLVDPATSAASSSSSQTSMARSILLSLPPSFSTSDPLVSLALNILAGAGCGGTIGNAENTRPTAATDRFIFLPSENGQEIFQGSGLSLGAGGNQASTGERGDWLRLPGSLVPPQVGAQVARYTRSVASAATPLPPRSERSASRTPAPEPEAEAVEPPPSASTPAAAPTTTRAVHQTPSSSASREGGILTRSRSNTLDSSTDGDSRPRRRRRTRTTSSSEASGSPHLPTPPRSARESEVHSSTEDLPIAQRRPVRAAAAAAAATVEPLPPIVRRSVTVSPRTSFSQRTRPYLGHSASSPPLPLASSSSRQRLSSPPVHEDDPRRSSSPVRSVRPRLGSAARGDTDGDVVRRTPRRASTLRVSPGLRTFFSGEEAGGVTLASRLGLRSSVGADAAHSPRRLSLPQTGRRPSPAVMPAPQGLPTPPTASRVIPRLPLPFAPSSSRAPPPPPTSATPSPLLRPPPSGSARSARSAFSTASFASDASSTTDLPIACVPPPAYSKVGRDPTGIVVLPPPRRRRGGGGGAA